MRKMVRYFYKFKIRTILITAILGFTVVLLAVQFGVLYAAISDLIGEKVSQVSAETSRQIGKRVQTVFVTAQEAAVNVRMSDEVVDLLNLPEDADYFTQIRLNERIQKMLAGVANTKSELAGIYILTEKLDIYNYAAPNSVFETGRLASDPIFQAIQKSPTGFVSTRPNPFDVGTNQSNHLDVSTYFFNIYGKSNTYVATICVNIEESQIRQIFNETQSLAGIYLFDRQGNLVAPYNRDQEQQEKARSLYEQASASASGADYFDMKIDGEKFLCVREQFGDGWTLLHLKPHKELMSGVGAILSVMSIVLACCLVVTLIFALYLSKLVSDPIKQLTDRLVLLDKNDLNVQFDESFDNEIGRINHRMNKIVRRLNDMIQSVVEDQDKIRQSELKALQAQINPHFLYNSLDSINWMAIKIGAEDISNMANQLGLFFRYSLNKGKSMTTIERELTHLRAYVAIQSYRYNNAFTYTERLDPELLHCQTVHLILQPLVENSLLHGAEASGGACAITVSAEKDGEDVVITVADDGCGCNSELMNQCLEAGISMSDGYGVQNVNQRIKIAFGDGYGMTYQRVEIGSKVEIRFPFIKELQLYV